MDHLHRWIEFFDFHRDRNGFAAHRDKMIDIYSVFARDDAADADGLLADWRQHLAAVDHDEIVGAAAIVAIQQHESGLAPSVPDHVAERILDEHVKIVRMLVGPGHRHEEFGLAVDLSVLRVGGDGEQCDEEQEGKDLQRLEQHDREWIERLLLRHEVEFIDHSAASARFSRIETTRTSVSPTAKANSFAVASSSM